MTKTEFANDSTEDLLEYRNDLQQQVPKELHKLVSLIVEVELELEQRSNV